MMEKKSNINIETLHNLRQRLKILEESNQSESLEYEKISEEYQCLATNELIGDIFSDEEINSDKD